MSRSIDLLNKAREQKMGKYSMALDKDLPQTHTQVSATHTPWMIWSVLLVILLSNFGLTFKLFMTQRGHADENNSVIAKLNKVEGLLTGQASQISTFSDGVNQRIESINSKFAQIDKDNDARIVKIEYLDKAKSALSKKVNLLQAQLEIISNINNATTIK
jgi:hypothetical protein